MAKLRLDYDRTIILQRIECVRQIWKKVMHFDADPLPDEEKGDLPESRRILQEL